MVWNSVLHGVAPDPTPHPTKTQQDLALEIRVIKALGEYRLVKQGVSTYDALGYGCLGGGVSEIKTLEFLAFDVEFTNARENKRDRAAARREAQRSARSRRGR